MPYWVTSCLAPIALEPIFRKLGFFVIRILIGSLTTIGAGLLLLYWSHPYSLYASYTMMGLSSNLYFIANLKELTGLYPEIKVKNKLF